MPIRPLRQRTIQAVSKTIRIDLQEDPDERRSVYDDPAYADVVTQLKEKLTTLRQRYDVPANDPL